MKRVTDRVCVCVCVCGGVIGEGAEKGLANTMAERAEKVWGGAVMGRKEGRRTAARFSEAIICSYMLWRLSLGARTQAPVLGANAYLM